MARPEKVRLGEILVTQKLLSEEQLEFALREQKRTGRKLGEYLLIRSASKFVPCVNCSREINKLQVRSYI
ncbi:MAG: hypothetical protein ABI351_03425 [Herbaspirillum sp.]